MSVTPKYQSVAAAIEAVTGNRPHPTSCWRFSHKGVGGVVLKTVMVGGRRMTTLELVQEWIEQRTAATTPKGGVSKVRAQLNKELRLSQ